MESVMNHYNEQEAYNRARKRAKEIRSFYINLACYCIVIPILIIINVTYTPEIQWFWFSMIGWGTGILFHGFSAFGTFPFLGPEWENRKMREFMEKEDRKQNNEFN